MADNSSKQSSLIDALQTRPYQGWQAILPGETRRPAQLVAAMRHALLAGGKRFRPFLVVECARLFRPEDVEEDGLWRVAAAVDASERVIAAARAVVDLLARLMAQTALPHTPVEENEDD